MSASKKKTTTRKPSPAPATKSAAPARKAASRSAARPAAVPSTPAAPAVVASLPPALAKPAAPRPSLTTITAQVDVGFGNTLYIRGAGGGLSWTVGLPMTCVAADLWRISLDAARQDIAFKVLLNDLAWSSGADYIATAGSTVTARPSF
ncbi:MAG: hypothetical protein LW690_03295 [Opitutaceae bacterium]|jgi:hypothetical protein|nr:hypothetical protein [Opitutaceae bacterium]